MRSLGYPESIGESIQLNPKRRSLNGARSDGTMLVYNSSFNPVARIKFKDMFPVSLTPVPFTAECN